jgi:hypothetical protein
MKFLVIQKIKRDLPLEKWVKLLPLQFKYFEKLEKEKTIEVEYHLIGQHNRVVITWQKIHGASISRRLSRFKKTKLKKVLKEKDEKDTYSILPLSSTPLQPH